MPKDYGSWKLADLKAELRKRNAKMNGKKAVLVKRLEDYDKLFGPIINSPETTYKIVVPDPDQFRDITSDSEMPILSFPKLEEFCSLAERDNVGTSENMYREKFLKYCRSAKKDGEYYIVAVCSSEMRKNITYNVTVKLQDNLILAAQCECAAGAGPYGQCKHIFVVLYGIIDFNLNKCMKLKASPTSTLQTFHQPSTSYSGNPVLAENLNLKFRNTKMKEVAKFDPRCTVIDPLKYRENFNNLVANYCSTFKENLPVAHLLKHANKKAMYQDHCYLKNTAEEDFFNSLILSPEELQQLEEQTKNDKVKRFEARKLRVPSSSFGRICKQKSNLMNPATSFLKSNDLQTEAIKHGNKYEAQAIKRFEELTGKSVTKCGIIVHPQFQFLGSIPDGLVGECELLEVKCPFTAKFKNISGDTVPYLYLCEKSGILKLQESHDYHYQIQGQMFCAQKSAVYFFVYTISDSYVVKIERDENFISEMIPKLKSFYEQYYKEAMLDRFLYNKRIY